MYESCVWVNHTEIRCWRNIWEEKGNCDALGIKA